MKRLNQFICYFTSIVVVYYITGFALVPVVLAAPGGPAPSTAFFPSTSSE